MLPLRLGGFMLDVEAARYGKLQGGLFRVGNRALVPHVITVTGLACRQHIPLPLHLLGDISCLRTSANAETTSVKVKHAGGSIDLSISWASRRHIHWSMDAPIHSPQVALSRWTQRP